MLQDWQFQKNFIEFLDLVEKLIFIVPTYNIDETDLSYREEREKCGDYLKRIKRQWYPVDRKNKHATLVVTTSADGDANFHLAVT